MTGVPAEDFDAVVVGAGPAGLAAAQTLATHGAATLVLDEQTTPGGQIYRGIERNLARHPARSAALGSSYAAGAALVSGFRASGADYRPGSTVWQITPGREVWYSRGGRSMRAQAGALVLATGAMERAVPIPGWTLPGVVTAGALQTLLKMDGMLPCGRLVLAGAGPLLLLYAAQCFALGLRPAALLHTGRIGDLFAGLGNLPVALRHGEGRRLLTEGMRLLRKAWKAAMSVHLGVSDLRVEGDGRLAGVSFLYRGQRRRVGADWLALHQGVIPTQQVLRSAGCTHIWDAAAHCFRPSLDAWGHSSVSGVFVAGDAAGIAGAQAAVHRGRIAALAVLARIARITPDARDAAARKERRALALHLAVRPLLDRLFPPPAAVLRPADEVIVCRCEEVTACQLRDAVRRGLRTADQAKNLLRCGMGPCQGRLCGPTVTTVMAEASGRTAEEIGYFRIREPIKPLRLGELAAMNPSQEGAPVTLPIPVRPAKQSW